MATKSKTTAVTSARTSSKEVQTSNKPASSAVAVYDEQFAEQIALDAGKGFEEASRDAYAIPFLSILQDLSPQTKKKMAGYIEGAVPGQIYESVSQSLRESVRVIPCHFSQVFIEWVPRAKGGGFVGIYDPIVGAQKAKTGVRDSGALLLPNGNELHDTRQHFCLQLNEDGSTNPCLIALKSSGIKVSRRWMSQMQSAVIEVKGRIISPPMFAWSYKLGAEEEANDKGSWYQWTIGDRERVTDIALYTRARSFGQTMAQGKVKVNYEEMMTEADRAGGQGDVPADIDNDM
jgi:hypothetical protein